MTDAARVQALAAALADRCQRPWTLMEVCGGQTHAIVRWGLDQLLPPGLELLHGPGCPVCVTPTATIEAALQLALRPEVILCSYGDMLRVPGGPATAATTPAQASETARDLLAARAAGGDVRLLTSPLQALDLALQQPRRQVVFLAVGFETTAPATALLALRAQQLGLSNLSLLNAHVRVVPAMEALLAAGDSPLQGFLAAGHVCTVTGTAELEALVQRWGVPVVVSGFSAEELMRAMLEAVHQLESGRAAVVNAYGRVVRRGGNPAAQRLLQQVFEPVTMAWRGLGPIEAGGLQLRPRFAGFDAWQRFALQPGAAGTDAAGPGADCGCPVTPPRTTTVAAPQEAAVAAPVCIAGAVLRGRARPGDCPCFGVSCRPEQPLGAPMVSSEGACAAYWRYRR